jgi:hypothetical protein
MMVNSAKAKQLQGTWGHDENWAEFTVKVGRAGIRVSGRDVDNNEALVISNIRWDGHALSFDALSPATGWIIGHSFTPKRGGSVEEVTTFRQTLKRRRPTTPSTVRCRLR